MKTPERTVRLSRRDFLKKIGRTALAGAAITSGGFLLTACKDEPPEPEITPKVELSTVPETDSKKELVRAIGELPPSAVKNALLHRISPLYQGNLPTVIDLGGTPVKVYSARVAESIVNKAEVFGNSALSSIDPEVTIEQVNLVDTFITQVPYIGLTRDEDVARFEKASDGSAIIPIQLQAESSVFEGMTLDIGLSFPDFNLLSESEKPTYSKLKDFVRVKEACTLFIYLEWLSLASKKMRELGQPTQALARKPNGEIYQIEMLDVINIILNNNGGRYVAGMDIAASLIALEAYRDTSMIEVLKDVEVFAEYLSHAENNNLGTSEEEILRESCKLAINSPNGENKFPHVGNLELLP